MVRKLIAWALDNPLVVILLAIFLAVIGRLFLHERQRRGLSRPGAGDRRSDCAVPRRVGRGGRAAGDHSAGGDVRRHARAEEDQQQVALRPQRPQDDLELRQRIHAIRRAGRKSSTGWRQSASRCRRASRRQSLRSRPPAKSSATSSRFPRTRSGRNIYTLNDIKAMQDWVLEREFRTVPRIVDVTSFGGTVRRYEVQPDPDRLRRYGITLGQLQTTLANSNATVGGDYLNQGQVAMTVRSVGLFGGGLDPVNKVLGLKSPTAAAIDPPRRGAAADPRDPRPGRHLGQQPAHPRGRRGRGRTARTRPVARRAGVVVSNQTRLGRIGYWQRRHRAAGGLQLSLADVGHDEDDRGDVHRALAQGRGHAARP